MSDLIDAAKRISEMLTGDIAADSGKLMIWFMEQRISPERALGIIAVTIATMEDGHPGTVERFMRYLNKARASVPRNRTHDL